MCHHYSILILKYLQLRLLLTVLPRTENVKMQWLVALYDTALSNVRDAAFRLNLSTEKMRLRIFCIFRWGYKDFTQNGRDSCAN